MEEVTTLMIRWIDYVGCIIGVYCLVGCISSILMEEIIFDYSYLSNVNPSIFHEANGCSVCKLDE